jgi:hypothetical protein
MQLKNGKGETIQDISNKNGTIDILQQLIGAS